MTADRRINAIAQLERALGYRFADRELLDQALTHASFLGQGRAITHNERLEFLGDRVLGLLTAERLVSLYAEEREGPLSNRLHSIVDRPTCARVARRIGLPDCVRRNAIKLDKVSPESDTALADTIEALLAATYLDGGLDVAREVFLRLWSDEIAAARPVNANPKVTLQEWLNANGKSEPVYEIIKHTGPAHAPTILVEVRGDFATAQGSGRSRRDAEKAAAQQVLTNEGLL